MSRAQFAALDQANAKLEANRNLLDKLLSDKKELESTRSQSEAELERKKATDSMKQEIVEVSGALAEKLLERELNREDHKAIIESFIEEIGDGND